MVCSSTVQEECMCYVVYIMLSALKMLDVKMTDVKLMDQSAGHEIAGHEIAGHKRAGYESETDSEVANV